MSDRTAIPPDEEVRERVKHEVSRFRDLRLGLGAAIPELTFETGAEFVRVKAPDWWVDLSFDRVTGKKRARFFGNYELAATVIAPWLPEDYWQGLMNSLAEERERFFHNAIPGTKKQAKSKIAPGQLEVGEHRGRPVFGQPLPKKRGKR